MIKYKLEIFVNTAISPINHTFNKDQIICKNITNNIPWLFSAVTLNHLQLMVFHIYTYLINNILLKFNDNYNK